MKKSILLFGFVMTFMLHTFHATNIYAEERATRQECFEKISQASALIQEIGPAAAYEKIINSEGPFVWKDASVFCINTKTAVLQAHTMQEKIGAFMRFYPDAEGGFPYNDILHLLEIKTEGWYTYMSDEMGKAQPRLKHIRFQKVPGKDLVLCSGYFSGQ